MIFKELSEKDVIQNLRDAGCNDGNIDEFMNVYGNKKDMLKLLRKYRIDILNTLHPIQKNLECLDYLIYRIRKAG